MRLVINVKSDVLFYQTCVTIYLNVCGPELCSHTCIHVLFIDYEPLKINKTVILYQCLKRLQMFNYANMPTSFANDFKNFKMFNVCYILNILSSKDT